MPLRRTKAGNAFLHCDQCGEASSREYPDYEVERLLTEAYNQGWRFLDPAGQPFVICHPCIRVLTRRRRHG